MINNRNIRSAIIGGGSILGVLQTVAMFAYFAFLFTTRAEPFGFVAMGVFFLTTVVIVISWLVSLIDVAQNEELPKDHRLLWVVAIMFFGIMGTLAYWLMNFVFDSRTESGSLMGDVRPTYR